MNAPLTSHPVPPYKHTPLFPLGKDTTPYRKITGGRRAGREDRAATRCWSSSARRCARWPKPRSSTSTICCGPAISRSSRKILDDPEATANDKFVAYDLLKNANIAAGGVLPMCQDTGTAIVMGKKGRLVWTDGDDEERARRGRARRLPEAQPALFAARAALDVRGEEHRNNLPAQIDIYAEGEDAYKFLFIAKGGGSANKTFLFQATPSLLTHDRMIAFLKEKILTLGTAACPPYHLAIVIGGTSAELTLKTVKLASTRYLDDLPTQGCEDGHAFRDLAMEAGDPQADAGARRRRAVRRQVFLPRRARDPPAAPRRLAADRARRVVLGRPPGAGQDHPRRRLPRGARAQSGAVSAARSTRRRSAATS